MIVSPFTKYNQDNLNFLNFACKTLQLLIYVGGHSYQLLYTQLNLQYRMEENSSSVEVLEEKIK